MGNETKISSAGTDRMTTEIITKVNRLTDRQFHALAALPAELEWFSNIENPRTRLAYKADVGAFMAFVGIEHGAQLNQVGRGHVLAWRADLVSKKLGSATIRRKLAAVSSMFEYLANLNAVASNPVKGVKRPVVESYEGKTPALSDDQARRLLAAPDSMTTKGLRDRAILSVLLYHGLRRAELCALDVGDRELRAGLMHLRVQGKGGKLRYVPLHQSSAVALKAYLDHSGHAANKAAPLFQGTRGTRTGERFGPAGVYKDVVLKYGLAIGLADMKLLGPHVCRATAATTALERGADIAKVQEWLGHSNIATTKLYDRRNSKAEDSPTFKVSY